MESSIFHFFAGICHGLAVWFDNSVFGRGFNAVCAFLGKVFRNCFLGKAFRNGLNTTEAWRESVLYKILHLPVRFCQFVAGKVGETCERISETSNFMWITDNWELVSVRIYGMVLFFFALAHAVINSALNGVDALPLILDGALAVVAVFMILLNRSMKSLFKGSGILRLIGGLFCDIKKESSRLFLQDKDIEVKGTILAAFIGIICAVLAVLLPLKLFVILVGGIFVTLVILKYLEAGVFLVVIGSPVLPTMVLAGLCLLCVLSFFVRLVTDRHFKLRCNALDVFVVFFIGALLYGTLNSFTFAKSAQIFLIYLAYVLFYFILINTITTPGKWRGLIVSFVLMACLVAMYGVLQNFTGISSTQSWVDSEMFTSIKTRVYSTFDNPNVLGEFLVIMIPTTIALIWANKKQGHKLIYTFVVLMMCACIVFTWSRGAWLGVMLAVALFLLIMDKRWALAGLVGLMMIPFVLGSNNPIADRILSIGNTEDTSTAYRVSIWQGSINLIKDFWLSGIGLGSEAYSMVYPKYALAGANFALHSHNLFLQIWVEMGVIGIISFLALIVAFFKQAFSMLVYRGRGRLLSTVVIAASAGVLGYLFQGLTDNVWYNYKMLLIFWIVLGLVSAGVNLRKEETQLR